MSFACVAKSKSRLNQYWTSHSYRLNLRYYYSLKLSPRSYLYRALIWKTTIPNSIAHAYSRARESKCVCTRIHMCALRVHDLCAFTSRDFALTQCQRPVFTTRALFGSRSAEGVHPAYVVNTLTILHEAKAALVCASPSYHLPRIGRGEAKRVCLRQLRPAGMWSRSFTFNRLAMQSSGSWNLA